MNRNEMRIFRVLYNEKEPMTGYEIAQKANVPISSAYYFVNKMVKKGVVIEFKEEEITLYALNPLFFNSDLWENIISSLADILKKINEKDIEYGKPDAVYALQLMINSIINQ